MLLYSFTLSLFFFLFFSFFLFVSIVRPSGGVWVSPSTLTASGGDNVSIECTAQGGPDNMLAWKFNGSVLSNGGRYTVTPFSLTIAGVVGEDHGLYTCEATNFAGIGNSTSSLTGYSLLSSIDFIFIYY